MWGCVVRKMENNRLARFSDPFWVLLDLRSHLEAYLVAELELGELLFRPNGYA